MAADHSHRVLYGFSEAHRNWGSDVLLLVEGIHINAYMWHSRRKSTFWRKNTKMSYLYHVVALTLLYLLVLVALQSVLLFPSYEGKWVDH